MFNLVRAEILKQRRSTFVKVVTLSPFIGLGLLTAVYVTFKIGGSDFGDPPNAVGNMGNGLFALSSAILLNGLHIIFAILLIALASQIISNEYRWNTIKMLAIREPSRPKIVISKAIFLAIYTLFMMILFIICWLAYGFILKLIYAQPLKLNAQDNHAIALGFNYVWPTFLGMLIWALLALVIGSYFHSVGGAIIAYLIYSTVDSYGASLGVSAIRGQLENLPNWLMPVVGFFKLLAPFLVNTNVVRLIGVPDDASYLGSILPVQAVIVLIAWLGFFSGLAILIFNRRDITD